MHANYVDFASFRLLLDMFKSHEYDQGIVYY